MIEVSKASASYGKSLALDSISFKVKAGSFVSVIGPNGAGKSTLIKMLLGVLPCQGKVTIKDNPIETLSRKELGQLISYVPQNFTPDSGFSVYEFVLLSRFPHSSRFSGFSTQDKSLARNALELTELEHLADRILTELSGGELQRSLLAAAICQDTPILLLDEFSASLDPSFELQMHKLLHQLQEEKEVTIISSCHDINRAALSSNEVIALKNGKLVFSGPPSALMDPQILREVYNDLFCLVPHPERPEIKMMLPSEDNV